MSTSYLFTSESVSEGHPDKVCDQISDAVLDAILAQHKTARVACETLVKNNMVVLAGEISTTARVDFDKIARGGFFIWLSLPEGGDTLEILPKAKERNLEFMPGPKFSSRQGLKNCLRLSFAYYDTPDLLKGIERLAAVIGQG